MLEQKLFCYVAVWLYTAQLHVNAGHVSVSVSVCNRLPALHVQPMHVKIPMSMLLPSGWHSVSNEPLSGHKQIKENLKTQLNLQNREEAWCVVIQQLLPEMLLMQSPLC